MCYVTCQKCHIASRGASVAFHFNIVTAESMDQNFPLTLVYYNSE